MPFTKTILDDLAVAESPSKFSLVRTVWPRVTTSLDAFQEQIYAPFLEYVDREYMYLKRYQSELAAESLEGTANLIPLLRDNLEQPRETVLAQFRGLFPDVSDGSLFRTVELVARLWLTTRVTLGDTGFSVAMQTSSRILEWPPDTSLKEAMESQLAFQEPLNGLERYFSPGLDPSFTAAALVDLCGIKLSWTSNLMDHLRLDKRNRILTVYEHKICLLNHVKGSDSPIPLPLLQEAIDTLNLLFPFGHDDTRRLLRQQNKLALYRLGSCNRRRRLAIRDYQVWRMQIASLIDEFNEPPRDWWQLLTDRRNFRDWATFWIGMMVLVLTVVSIVTGTVSSVYAVKQYNLAREQACAACAAI